MAPRPTYDPPHVQLGRLMVQARRRGLSFEAWWEEAVRPSGSIVMVTHPSPPAGAVRWPTDRADRLPWQAAIAESREGWRRAFEREEPTRNERALAVLGDSIGVLMEMTAVLDEDEQDAAELAIAELMAA